MIVDNTYGTLQSCQLFVPVQPLCKRRPLSVSSAPPSVVVIVGLVVIAGRPCGVLSTEGTWKSTSRRCEDGGGTRREWPHLILDEFLATPIRR